MENIIHFACLLLFFCCSISCGKRMLSREEIITHYGTEVINYFYETAFHADRGGGVLDEAHRWNKDILVSLHGDMLKKDSLFVRRALSAINDLDLAISMRLTDSTTSNLQIYFGDAPTVAKRLNRDSVVTVGVGVVWWNKYGALVQGKIGIVNDAKIYTQIDSISAVRLREATILEEMVQGLGIVGDSFTYYESLFFEGPNETTENFKGLSEIDAQTIKFLYDKRIFGSHLISRKDFEERFSEMLYNHIGPEKFQELAREYTLDRQDLDSLGKMVFRPETKDTFVKFPRNAFIKLSGESTDAHLNFCKALVAEFNSITPYFQITLVKHDRLWNHNPSITIHFEEGEEHKETVHSQTEVTTKEMMFKYKILGDIWLKFSDPKKEVVPYPQAIFAHNKSLTRSLFKVLGVAFPGKVLISGDQDNPEIDKKYKDYFRFLYDPRFPSGISETKFEEVLKNISKTN